MEHKDTAKSKVNLYSISTISKNLNREYRMKYQQSIARQPQCERTLQENSLNVSFPELKRGFSDILTKLDGILEKRFRTEYLRLDENEKITGLIDQGTFQYFNIEVRGKRPPVSLNFVRKRGKLKIFASFRFTHPNHTVYDYKFNSDYIELQGRKSSQFVDSKLYIGIFAQTDCVVSILCTFGVEAQPKQLIKTTVVKRKPPGYINELSREDAASMQSLKPSEDDIPEKITQTYCVNYVRANKALNISTVKHKQLQSLHEKSLKLIEIRQRKKQLIQEKSNYFQNRIRNKEYSKLLREQQGLRAETLLTKQKFIRKWSTLILFFKTSLYWKTQFETKQQKSQQIIIQLMSVTRIQRKYHKLHPPSFPLSYRHFALARSTLILFSNCFSLTHRPSTVLKFLQGSSVNASVKAAFTHYIIAVLKVQRRFRKFRILNEDMFDELIVLWDQVASDLNSSSPRSSKEEKALIKAISLIPAAVKMGVLRQYMQKVKSQVYDDIKRGGGMVLIKYWPKDETMQELIMAAASKAMHCE